MMEAVRTSETSVDNHFTRQYKPEDSSEHLQDMLETTFLPGLVMMVHWVDVLLKLLEK
jgi:hypothetical protein